MASVPGTLNLVNDDQYLSLKAGRHLVAWGESLFWPNIIQGQAPVDSTKFNVPGTEAKDAYLPVGQVSGSWSVNEDLALLGFYQYKWEETQLNQVGDYFGSDTFGPGAEFYRLAPGIIESLHNCTFVCAIGGSLKAGEYMNPDHICRRLALRFGAESETLYAPALVANPELRSVLINNDTVRSTLDRARRADIALIGIGDMSENSNMVRMGWFSPQEIAQARVSGTVGDMMGYDFIDIHGQPAVNTLQGRVIGLTVQELVRIPDVVAIASENTKAAATLGALRSGVINTLATTVSNAYTILALDDATRR